MPDVSAPPPPPDEHPPGQPSPTGDDSPEQQLRAFARRRDEIKAEHRRNELQPVVDALNGILGELRRVADAGQAAFALAPPPAHSGEPDELRDLPPEVRRLVHAVDRVRGTWAESNTPRRQELWREMHAANDAVWARLDPPADEQPVEPVRIVLDLTGGDDALKQIIREGVVKGPGGHAVKAWQNAHERATKAETERDYYQQLSAEQGQALSRAQAAREEQRTRAERAEAERDQLRDKLADIRAYAGHLDSVAKTFSFAADGEVYAAISADLINRLDAPPICTCSMSERCANCRATDPPTSDGAYFDNLPTEPTED